MNMAVSLQPHPVQAIPRKRTRPPEEVRFAHWLRTTFKIPAGVRKGEPFDLHPFQMELVREYLGRAGDDPLWRTLIYSTPRKLGKSTLLGAVLLGRMCPDSPIYIPGFAGAVAAPSEKHATYIAKAMRELLETAGREAELRHKSDPKPGILIMGGCRVWLSTGTRGQGHGADLDLAVIDETGLITGNQSDLITGFFDALATRNGQLILTGTRGDSPAYNDLLERPDKRTYVVLHAANRDDDPADPAVWAKANPGLGTIKPMGFMRDAHAKAEQSGSLAEFKAWQLNMPLSPTRELLLDYDVLRKSYRDKVHPIPGEPVHLGIDLGGSASMTAACIAYEQSGIIKVLGAFPSGAMDLHERGKRDLVGDLWSRCAADGDLIETSGNITDMEEFFPELLARIGNHPVASVSCDRYRREEFATAMAKARISWPVVYRGQGPRDGDKDIRATRRLFLAEAIQMERSLLLEGSLVEADVKVATTGACQLSKAHSTARMDVCSAMVLACSALLRERDRVRPVYEAVDLS